MLIIIPARGGSKTVRRKNLQPVAGKPLFLHVAGTARAAFPNTRIIVSTDDPEIVSVAEIHGYEIHHRSGHTSSDTATIHDVVAEVTTDTLHDGPVLLVQPTVPQITVPDLWQLVEAKEAAVMGNLHRHITWQSGTPLTDRVNRQENIVWPTDEIGVYWWPERLEQPSTIIPTQNPVTDIDTWADLQQVRQQLDGATVLFRFRANKQTGSGHLHRCLALAAELQQYQVVMDPTDSEPWVSGLISNWAHISEAKHVGDRALVVNDLLDTTTDDVLPFQQRGYKVVNLEDHGEGARFADLIINALYHPQQEDDMRFVYGPKWAVLRPEFQALPDYTIRTDGYPKVLALFGGTDPGGMADRISKHFPRDTVIRPGDNISVAAAMMSHDILVTSAGRTVYEAAAVGIPTVVIAQNARETTHSHLSNTVYLGLGALTELEQIQVAVQNLWAHPDLREEMSVRSRRSVDGLGARRIAHQITGLLEGL